MYIDIHSHILPGLDDGSRDRRMSMEMLHLAVKNRIGRIIATPHYKPMRRNASPQTIRSAADRLEEAAGREGLEVRLYAGNEIYYHSEIVERLEKKEICTLADSSYVLVEFGPADSFDYIRGGIHRIVSGGYRPVLAHVERYGGICAGGGAAWRERAQELAEMGCCLQVNAGSVMGRSGYAERQLARRLLKRGMVHFVGTDAHDRDRRRPSLLDCASYIGRRFGEDAAQRLLIRNPQLMMDNQYL